MIVFYILIYMILMIEMKVMNIKFESNEDIW